MEILLVLIVLAVIAAAAFMYMRSRQGGPGLSGRGQGSALRGPRRTRAAERDDPMADAVERHAMATDPHEAAEAELRLQAQANRVASDLHAQQASTLESQAGGAGRLGGRGAAMPADEYAQPADAYGRPADAYGQPADAYGQPVQPVYEDEHGRPVHEDGQPVHQDGRQPLPEQEGGAAYHDEHGRPVYPEERPRY